MKQLVAFFACMVASEACSCLPFGSGKQAFCSSEFGGTDFAGECIPVPTELLTSTVSHVMVMAKNDPNKNSDGYQDITYKVKHTCVYRNSMKSYSQQLSSEIITASNSAACGIELTVGEEYLIGGSVDKKGVLHSYLCGIVQEWSTVPETERTNMKKYVC